jgi:polyisoprenoid-binding protein YceI
MNQVNQFKTNAKKSVAALALVVTAATLVACASGTGSTPIANTGWAIDGAQSSLNFVTTKAGQAGVGGIGEVQSFKRFTGGMDAAGQIKLVIDLASVDTGVEIRDERLRTMLWNIKATPQATFTAKLSANDLAKLSGDAVSDIDVAGQLELAGQAKPVTAKLRTMRLGGGKIMVTTRAPIIINSNDFGLKPGVEAMREVMNLNFLASTAPVNFSLVLNAQNKG